jgi:hypothetical protein
MTKKKKYENRKKVSRMWWTGESRRPEVFSSVTMRTSCSTVNPLSFPSICEELKPSVASRSTEEANYCWSPRYERYLQRERERERRERSNTRNRLAQAREFSYPHAQVCSSFANLTCLYVEFAGTTAFSISDVVSCSVFPKCKYEKPACICFRESVHDFIGKRCQASTPKISGAIITPGSRPYITISFFFQCIISNDPGVWQAWKSTHQAAFFPFSSSGIG